MEAKLLVLVCNLTVNRQNIHYTAITNHATKIEIWDYELFDGCKN